MAGLAPNVRFRLSVMMFLQYAFNGIWIIPLFNYLTKTVGYSDGEAAGMFSTTALGFIIAPFFVGMIADRFFSAEKILGVLNILAAVFLYMASEMAASADGKPQPGVMFWILLAHFLCYSPTWALTNTIALNQMSDPGKQFPSIRVMGTFGWIAVSTMCLFSDQITTAFGVSQKFEYTKVPMFIGSGIGLAAGLFSFFLPNTPPKSIGHTPTFGDIIGVKALSLFKDRNFLVFALTTFLILLPNMFYWGFCNMYLNETGMANVQFKQSIGQMAEVVFLYLMPLFFIRYGVKTMLAIGFLAWLARFFCFAFGYQTASLAFLLYTGLALHGICWDFFFVTGQLYTDKKAPKEVQASAQGLLSLITFGLGWFIGVNIAGTVIGQHATHQLAASDLLNKPALYAEIVMEGLGAAEPGPAKRVWELFDTETRQAIAEETKGTGGDASREGKILNALNAMVVNPGLYGEADFAKIVAKAQADKDVMFTNLLADQQKMVQGGAKMKDADLKELNRLLLERSFPGTIAPNRHLWSKIWLYPAGMAIVLFVFFMLGFRDKMLVVEKEDRKTEPLAA
ncbi:MAG: MFS transporter [Planctomycetota bacterium]|nr:MFS transporter [Planctomycetota bacterium]